MKQEEEEGREGEWQGGREDGCSALWGAWNPGIPVSSVLCHHSAFALGCSELLCEADGHRGSGPRFQEDCSVWRKHCQYLQGSPLSDILTTRSPGRCFVLVFSMQIFTVLLTRKGFFFFFQFKMPNRWWQLLSLFWRLDASQPQF